MRRRLTCVFVVATLPAHRPETGAIATVPRNVRTGSSSKSQRTGPARRGRLLALALVLLTRRARLLSSQRRSARWAGVYTQRQNQVCRTGAIIVGAAACSGRRYDRRCARSIESGRRDGLWLVLTRPLRR